MGTVAHSFNNGTPTASLNYIITTGQEEVTRQTNNGTREITTFSVNQSDFIPTPSPSLSESNIAIAATNQLESREIIGNDLDNVITVQDLENTLFGNGGNDRFILLGGINLVDGGEGIDTVQINKTQAEAGAISKPGNIINIGTDTTLLNVEFIEFSDVRLATTDDTPIVTPILSLAETGISITEGDPNSNQATFTINLSSVTTEDVVIDFATQSNVANAGTDFVEATGQLTIAAGESSGDITVEVLDDSDVEGEELVLLTLMAVSGATFAAGAINETAAINILDNESVISIPIVADDFTIIEGDITTPSTLTLNLDRFGSLSGSDTIEIKILAAGSNPAQASDFVDGFSSTRVTFAPGEETKTVDIAITPDEEVEEDETFGIRLTNVSGSASVSSETLLFTILNDDVINTPPTVATPIPDQTAIEDDPFTFTFSENTFLDPDTGDILTYSATLEDGSALPGWLNWDPNTRTLSGTPGNEDVGTLSITIIATDNQGATATETFDILTVEEVDPVIIGEVGTVTDFDHQSKTINFSRTYNNPVVIAGPLSYNGGHRATVRIEEVTGNSFTAFIQEPSNLDGVHSFPENFSYIVLEAGTWQWSDGTLVEVGAIDTNATVRQAWETIDFDTNFDQTPTIFSHVQSYNDGDFVRTRQRNDSADGFQFALEEEERKLNTRHLTETVGYVAITPGAGTINGLDYTVGSTPDSVDHNWYNLDFDADFQSSPNFLAQLASYDGPNSAGLRYRNLTGDRVQVFVEEDTSRDRETWHLTEKVNFLAIEGGVLSGNGYDPITGKVLINGTDSDEILVGTTGDDLISGGLGRNVFVFGQGNDIVSDFTDGVDKIGLTVEFEELTVTQIGGDSVISLGVDSLTLTGIDSGLLTESDFVSVI